MTESAVKTYYNDTTTISLSEQDVISYTYNTDTVNNGWSKLISPILYIKQNGVIDDGTLPFNGFNTHPTLIVPRPTGQEQISFNSYWVVMNIEGSDLAKRFLRLFGPCATALQLPSGGHAMLLYGYDKVQAGMNWGDDENPEYIPNNDPRIGRTIWKFKNSWGDTWGENGLVNIVCYNWSLLDEFYYINGALSSLTRTDDDIICEDADGDGYFYWGINHSIPNSLPSWAPRQEDADDSNAHVGPFLSQLLGNTKNINPDSLDIIYIDQDTIFSQDIYIPNHICIRNNSSLIVNHQLTMNRLSQIIINSGSSLIIDGGIVRHPIISPASGSTLIINNGGKVIPYLGVPFTLPTGANLQINQGSIGNP